ncbi:MAG: hypothetical protein ACXW4L_01690 [Candidatus Limnocylindrales bacterium]
MTAGPSPRDGEIEAFIVDRYLESLLSRAPLHPSEPAADIPSDVRAVADRLVRDLPRYHPSFRFEEDLAARLAIAAAATVPEGDLVAFPRDWGATARAASDPERGAAVRPVVIGSVITSAALSLAGAAYMAWRRSHQASDPMSRAARAVARARAV